MVQGKQGFFTSTLFLRDLALELHLPIDDVATNIHFSILHSTRKKKNEPTITSGSVFIQPFCLRGEREREVFCSHWDWTQARCIASTGADHNSNVIQCQNTEATKSDATAFNQNKTRNIVTRMTTKEIGRRRRRRCRALRRKMNVLMWMNEKKEMDRKKCICVKVRERERERGRESS